MTPSQISSPQVIRYSPRPLSEYRKMLGDVEYGPATSSLLNSQATWNLAYLSHDYETSMQHTDPNFTVHVRRTCQTKLDGTGLDIAELGEESERVESLLKLPAAQFVYLIERHSILKLLPLYTAYGEAWLTTIKERSRICQTDENPTDNVVDFSAAKALLARF